MIKDSVARSVHMTLQSISNERNQGELFQTHNEQKSYDDYKREKERKLKEEQKTEEERRNFDENLNISPESIQKEASRIRGERLLF